MAFFDCLHDMGDPLGALKRAAKMLKPDGTILLIEPQAAEHVEGNLNPVARIYSAASVLCCTPNALATGDTALGTLAPESALKTLARKASLTRFRKAWEDPFNRLFEIRR